MMNSTETDGPMMERESRKSSANEQIHTEEAEQPEQLGDDDDAVVNDLFDGQYLATLNRSVVEMEPRNLRDKNSSVLTLDR